MVEEEEEEEEQYRFVLLFSGCLIERNACSSTFPDLGPSVLLLLLLLDLSNKYIKQLLDDNDDYYYNYDDLR